MSKSSGLTAVRTPVPGNAFRKQILIRFRDCDSAKMVFYPRYLEYFNDLVEDWFSDGIGLPFDVMHRDRNCGLPTVHLEVDFIIPGRLGEVLTASLVVTRIGGSSIALQILMQDAEGNDRVRGRVVLVLTELGKDISRPIPPELREKIERYRIAE